VAPIIERIDSGCASNLMRVLICLTAPLKGIQRHGRRFRVQKRVDGDIRKWTFDNLDEAIKKRDAIFA
jgi:hypothetical protein